MAQHRKPRDTPIARRMSAESDVLRSCYSIQLHVDESGIMHSLVARMNLNTRRYQFTSLPHVALGVGDACTLSEALAVVSGLVCQDEETEWYTA